ncbi:MAG: EamA family transporter [Acidobacteriota bacterium]|nr:EamA family transporter [Acidobacteriota bacterium]
MEATPQAEDQQAERPLKLRHWLGFALLCAIWSTTWMAIRVLVAEVPPFRAASLRFAIASAFLLGLAAIRRDQWPKSSREWRVVTMLGVTMMTIPFGVVFWAEQYVTSSMTAVLSATTPLVIALLTPVMLRQPVPRRAVFAMVIGFGGIVALFWTGMSLSPHRLAGGLAILAGAVSTGWSAHYAKRNAQGISPVVSTGLQLAVGTVLLGALSMVVERDAESHWSGKAIAALLFLAVMGSAVAFAVWYWLLKRMRPYQLSTIGLIIPVGAMLEGALLLHEPAPPMVIAAVLVVLGAVATVLRAEPEKVLSLRD